MASQLAKMPAGRGMDYDLSRAEADAGRGLKTVFGQLVNLLKLRIGVIMMLTALVAMVVTPGPQPGGFEMLVLCFAVLISAGAAGAFNQYYEVDIDREVARTCTRPFVTGYFRKRRCGSASSDYCCWRVWYLRPWF